MLPMIPSKTNRFYQTVFKNHDNEILGMFCLRSNELLSIDSNGGLKRVNIDTLISETLDLFGDSKDLVTCVQANEEGDSLFFGLETGAIWTSDLTTSDELIYSHSQPVTAIASAKSTVFSAGLDLKIKMFNLKTQTIVANIDCVTEVNILKPLSNIFGLPLVVGDISGYVSIWSPHLLKSSTQSVQLCCQLSNKILSISQVTLFDRSCLVCTTATMISIYAIAVKKDLSEKDHVSLLKDEIYSLVRTISPPNQNTEFLSCISMNYTPPPPPLPPSSSLSNASNGSASASMSSTSPSPLPSVEMNSNATLLSSCSDGYVYQWEPLTGQVMRRYRVTNDSTLPCLALIYLPCYHMFAVTDSQNSLYLINFSSSPLVSSIPVAPPPAAAVASPTSPSPALAKAMITCATAMDIHSTLIAYGDSNGQVHLHSNRTHATHSRSFSALTAATAITMLFLEASEELVVITGHSNGMLFVYLCSVDGILPSLDTNSSSATNSSRHQQITGIYNSKITALQTISSSSTATAAMAMATAEMSLVATASELESIIIWKVSSKGMTKVTQLTDSAQMMTMIFHPEGYLIASDHTHQLHLWHANQNWKKIVPSSASASAACSRSMTSPRASLISSVSQKLGLYFDEKKGIHYIATALVSLSPQGTGRGTGTGGRGGGGGENKIKFYKISSHSHSHSQELLLDGIIELPLQCSDISFWSNGESNLVFLQSSSDGNLLSLNIQSYDSINSYAQSRHFLSQDYLLVNTATPAHLHRTQGRGQGSGQSGQTMDCELIAVSGNTSPIVLTCETVSTQSQSQTQTLHVWNNDLHDLDQFYHSSLLLALSPPPPPSPSSSTSPSLSPIGSSEDTMSPLPLPPLPLLYRLIESHPHYPSSLLLSEIPSSSSSSTSCQPQPQPQSFFFTTLLRYPTLFQKYLPMAPIAVTHTAFISKTKHSLLSYAILLNDTTAVDLILSQWISLLSPPSSLSSNETCHAQFHLMELFQDFKLLALRHPTKFSQFLTQLPLLPNHSIIQRNYSTHRMTSSFSFSSPSSALLSFGGTGSGVEEMNSDVCMMRGTEYRVVPSFWSSLNSSVTGEGRAAASKGTYPDLMGRVLAPEDEEILWKPFEQPHDCQAMQQSFTSAISHTSRSLLSQSRKRIGPPATAAAGAAADSGAVEEEEEEKIAQEGQEGEGSGGEGIMVQSFIHPIPHAASGIEFLSLCHSTHQLTGSKSSLLSSPLVSSVIDYKWNSFFSTSYHSRVFHSLFLLILFSFHCVYYEELNNSPTKTGLPALVFIVSVFLLINYLILFFDLCLRHLTLAVMTETSSSASALFILTDTWFLIGSSAYLSVITGIAMILLNRHDPSSSEEQHGIKMHTSFNARCLLSAASLLLFLQFLSSLMPLQSIGLFIHRLLLTLQFTSKNYFLLLFCILSFSISFNLMHHRHEGDSDSTFNSLYGSFLQSFIFAFGGYDSLDLFDTADSPLLMSLYFPLFIVLVLWILLLYLLISMNEIYQETEFKAICLWRENQTKAILSKSLLLKEDMEKNIFHHPKWLQILKPLYQQEYRTALTSSACAAGCLCGKSESDANTKESIDDIRRDVELLKDLFYQFQDSLHGLMQQQTLQHQQQEALLANALAGGGGGAGAGGGSDSYSETQLLEKIKLLMEQHCSGNGKAPPPSSGGLQAPSQLTVLRLPPKEADEVTAPPSKQPSPSGLQPIGPPPRAFSRVYSQTDSDDVRLPNDLTPNSPSASPREKKSNKSETGLRVRQIKSSKKKLSSKILGLDFDQST